MDNEILELIESFYDDNLGPRAIFKELREFYDIEQSHFDKLYRKFRGIPEPVDKESQALDSYLPEYSEETYELLLLGKGIKK